MFFHKSVEKFYKSRHSFPYDELCLDLSKSMYDQAQSKGF